MDSGEPSAGDVVPTETEVGDGLAELSIHVSESEESLFPAAETMSVQPDTCTTENIPDEAGDDLPHHINDDMLEDVSEDSAEDISEDSGDERGTVETLDTEDIETITSEDAHTETPIEEVLLKQESMFHCVLCENKYTEPKMLHCLHTFCYNCLDARKKESHKFIFCPICRQRTIVPKNGIYYLQTNVVIENMISLQNTVEKASSCVVCLLRDEEKPATGQCVDCADALCTDCCEKHTYSRQTATHIVISLTELMSEKNSQHLRGKQGVYCNQHIGEELKFYCSNCTTAVCRDCVLLKHGGHSCLPLSDVYEEKKKEIETALENLQRKRNKYDNYDQYIESLNTAENKELELIQETKKNVISIIEKMFTSYQDGLHTEFDKLRKGFLGKQKRTVYLAELLADTTELVEFYLKEGRDVEIITLQNVMSMKLENMKWSYQKIDRRYYEEKVAPTINVRIDNCLQLEKMHFCQITVPMQNKEKPPQSRRRHRPQTHQGRNVGPPGSVSLAVMAQTSPRAVGRGTLLLQQHCSVGTPGILGFQPDNIAMMMQMQRPAQNFPGHAAHVGNYTTSMRPTHNQQRVMGNQNSIPSLQCLATQPNNMMNHLTQFGPQGQGLPGQRNLFGGYTGGYSGNQVRNPGPVSQQMGRRPQQRKLTPQKSHQNKDQGTSKHVGGATHVSNNTNDNKFSLSGSLNLASNVHKSGHPTLTLNQTIDAKVMQDQYEPDIKGMTFTSEQNFAISDSQNSKIKLFSMSTYGGKFLQYFAETNPMSIAFCEGHLVLNKDNQTVCVKSMMHDNKTEQQKTFGGSPHPVTTFNMTKYLVANVMMGGGGLKVVAYQVNGTKVHTVEPKAKSGAPLDSVTDIAAHRKDQLVLVQNDRVIVNDFDSSWIGEYSGPSDAGTRWRPGCVCIDEADNIWVTDPARNKIVLLTSKGEFIQEWPTELDRPFCITVNHHGMMLVTGVGKTIAVYQYKY